MEVVICIATHKRSRLLQNLLAGLWAQTFSKLSEPGVHIIVIDNDRSGTGEAVCRNAQPRWPLTYRIEPRRGIAQARNRALREIGSADFVVFIDDDETPHTNWLEELLAARQQCEADVVCGPVLPMFPAQTPKWIVEGKFFDPPKLRDGESLEWCATNNTLVSRKVIDTIVHFDEQFQLSGVDDYHFFRQVHRAGFRIAWSSHAIVSEVITPDRSNLKWMLLRAFRGGNGAVLVEFALESGFKTRALRFAKAWARVLQGSVEFLPAIFCGRAAIVHAMRRVSLGAGMIAAFFGYVYQSHRVTTGE